MPNLFIISVGITVGIIDILLVILYIRSKDPDKSSLYLKIMLCTTLAGFLLILINIVFLMLMHQTLLQ